MPLIWSITDRPPSDSRPDRYDPKRPPELRTIIRSPQQLHRPRQATKISFRHQLTHPLDLFIDTIIISVILINLTREAENESPPVIDEQVCEELFRTSPKVSSPISHDRRGE